MLVMKRKMVSAVTLTLLLTSMLTLAFSVQPVNAEGTIYIRADGSIDPPDAPISTVDNVTYTLTGNISGDNGIVAERSNIIIHGAGYTLQGTGNGFHGFRLLCITNVTIRNTNIKNFFNGIWLDSSSNIAISGNNITNNGGGIYLDSSSNNSISGNNITNNRYGIGLYNSSNFNSISGNNITANNGGGISLDYSSNYNSISRNNITNNMEGIYLYSSYSNSISGNNITNNGYGIYLYFLSDYNSIFHNNFINNGQQVYSLDSVNIWDDGYPSGGNYWSNYTGDDLFSGPYQNITGSDGIGDTSYVIDADNQDRYPLMHPWSPLPVHNINTGFGYATIQEAINTPETLDGHAIFVEAGTYYENIVVNKTVSIIGESRATTLIDGNRTAEAAIITTNNTMLSGFTIQSSDPFIGAVRLENVSHTTIANNTITNSFSGLAVTFSDFNTIVGNNITKNTFRDAFVNSSNNILRDNTMEGLYVSKSINNTLVGNTIGSFMLSYSPDTMLRNNSFSVFGVYEETLPDFIQDIDSSNTVNGRPVYYWVNRENAEVPSDAGYVALIDCVNITVRGSNFENNLQSIIMFSTNNSRILNNNVTNINEGIWISSSSNNIIYGNRMTNNGFGIQLLNECSNNNIRGNNITANEEYGISHGHSSYNIIAGNNITNNGWGGIRLFWSSYASIAENNIANNGFNAISFWESSDNNIVGNNITNNHYGIELQGSRYNSISMNNITNNFYGIGFERSSINTFYHNNFIHNTKQVYAAVAGYGNVWDDGYPSGGNFWSDYVGVDVKSGLSQDLPESDGIGDTPYIIDADNQDRYPLMRPWTLMPTVYTFSIVWEEETFTVSVESNSTVSNFAFNQPNKEISFYVTGPDGTIGFSNVTIPKQLLYGEPWSVLIDGISVSPTIAENETHSILYFTYTHSTHKIQIIGTYVIAPPPPPLSVSISPLSASILVGQSVTFTSTVSGGYTPYSYQWYLNGNPVSGATSASWTFTPTTSGIYYIYLKVTDAKDNTAQSDTARITVATVPVGGYSIPIQIQTTTEPIIPYIALIAALTAIFTKLRPKTKRKH
jgi:parallel beta-helix repeat protein